MPQTERLARLTRHRSHAMKRPLRDLGLALCLGFLGPVHGEEPPAKRGPAYQYESDDIRIPIPSADEAKVASFGPESVAAAARYLEEGSLAWVRERSCVNCHTTGPYLSERPALAPYLGPANAEVLADFAESVPTEIKPVEPREKNGHLHHPGAFTAVWRSLGLPEWDKQAGGPVSEATDRSLRDMFERQSSSGAFVSHGEVEIPHITTYIATTQALKALALCGELEEIAGGAE